MNPCEFIKTCPFFHDKLGALPGLVNMLKKQYCLLVKTRCARYRVFEAVGREHVPSDLFPNDAERADSVIRSVEKNRKDIAI